MLLCGDSQQHRQAAGEGAECDQRIVLPDNALLCLLFSSDQITVQAGSRFGTMSTHPIDRRFHRRWKFVGRDQLTVAVPKRRPRLFTNIFEDADVRDSCAGSPESQTIAIGKER